MTWEVFWQRLKWLIGLGMIFLVVLATNMMDRRHFENVRLSIETMYEDRLQAQDYLFRIDRELDKLHFGADLNVTRIDSLLAAYDQTKLTAKESDYLKLFRRNYQQLQNRVATADSSAQFPLALKNKLEDSLDKLSQIQMEEGKRQLHFANENLESSDLIMKMELALLVLIVFLIQYFLIFRK